MFLDPLAGRIAGSVAKLSGAGAFLWGHEVAAASATMQAALILPSGDVLYSGSFAGAADLGSGVDTTPGASGASLFIVRRSY